MDPGLTGGIYIYIYWTHYEVKYKLQVICRFTGEVQLVLSTQVYRSLKVLLVQTVKKF